MIIQVLGGETNAIKTPARASTTGALPANTATTTTLTANANGALPAQDGVTLVVNDRLLVKNEVTGANNGIYAVTQIGTAGTPYILTRTIDANQNLEIVSGMIVIVSEGTVNADLIFELTTNNPIVVGTTALTFTIVGGVGAISGSGTLNRVAKFTPDGTHIGDSQLFDDGTSVGINTIAPSASALLDLTTTTKGFLAPRVTTAQRDAIAAPATGLLVYNTTTSLFNYYGGAAWIEIDSGTGDWNILGNAGTVDGTNFIGTTDNIPFNIRVNNQKAGRIDNVKFNAFFGYQSGNSISTGTSNTAFGDAALSNNTTSNNNSAFGRRALFTTITGTQNSAFGVEALVNTTGDNNSAFGFDALLNNVSGNRSSAFGVQSLLNSTGGDNSAFGFNSLLTNTTGTLNTAIGFTADVGSGALTNATAIGANAVVSSSNALVLGAVGVNVGIGTSTFGTNAASVLAIKTGATILSASILTDGFQMYSNDVVAGNAAPHFRTENEDVVKLFADGGWTAVTGTASKVGYATATATLQQVAQTVKAMQDHLIALGLYKA